MNYSPSLSAISTWMPVTADGARGIWGYVANAYTSLIQLPGHQGYGVMLTGWGYSGFDTKNPAPEPVRVHLIAPNGNGAGFYDATLTQLKDPLTNGASSVIVADFNRDNVSDIFLAAHNESPFAALPSTAYMSSPDGTYTKMMLPDSTAAHDASLVQINGQPAVLTSTYRGPANPLYQYQNGGFTVTPSPNAYSSITGDKVSLTGATTVADSFDGTGNLQIVRGDVHHYNDDWSVLQESNIEVFSFNPNNTIDPKPLQVITPYLSTLPQYANVVSMSGPGLTHTHALYTDDINHDGFTDVLAAQSMWSNSRDNWPSALQVLQNDGTGRFVDRTATLNPSMPLDIVAPDYTPVIADIDGSGIDTYLLASSSFFTTERQGNFVLLNDGTGRFHVGMHTEFEALSKQVLSFVAGRLKPEDNYYISRLPGRDDVTLKFLGVPQADGSIDFIASTALISFKDPANPQVSYAFTHVPTRFNPATDYRENVVITDRNDTQLIRTWAGNDTIFDTNAAASTSIKGGLGFDTVVYAAPSADAQVSRTASGFTVKKADGRVDTLQGIEKLQFSDKAVELPSLIDGFNPEAVYRFYNTGTGGHFYSASVHEAETIMRGMPSFTFEGVAFQTAAAQEDTVSVHRFYNASSGGHLYTTSPTEIANIKATLPQFSYEGVSYQAFNEKQEGTTELYRFHNKNTGGHLYTANAQEMESIRINLAGTYTYEGIAYYVNEV